MARRVYRHCSYIRAVDDNRKDRSDRQIIKVLDLDFELTLTALCLKFSMAMRVDTTARSTEDRRAEDRR